MTSTSQNDNTFIWLRPIANELFRVTPQPLFFLSRIDIKQINIKNGIEKAALKYLPFWKTQNTCSR
jgi:hypothetical protein